MRDYSITTRTSPAFTVAPSLVRISLDDAVFRRMHFVLHFHRLDDDHAVAFFDGLANLSDDPDHLARHRCLYLGPAIAV